MQKVMMSPQQLSYTKWTFGEQIWLKLKQYMTTNTHLSFIKTKGNYANNLSVSKCNASKDYSKVNVF
jgi:hypothetical protein